MILGDEANKGFVPLIGAIDDVKFRRPVVPGDQLRSEMELMWYRNQIGRIRGKSYVGDEVVASMELTFKLMKLGI